MFLVLSISTNDYVYVNVTSLDEQPTNQTFFKFNMNVIIEFNENYFLF